MARHLAIGDIHGCFVSLKTLADFVGFRADDVIVTLGDYVNRGPNTHAVLDWLLDLKKRQTLVALKGNHEIMMLEARESPSKFRYWMESGGDATLRSSAPFEGDPGRIGDIPDRHWRFLERLKSYYETDTHFFVHAGAYPDFPLDEQPSYMLFWEKWDHPPRHESGKIMVCGHTSQKSGLPITNGHAICIDTWACGGGWLSCLDAESGTIWQANEQGETRMLDVDELEDVLEN